MESRKFFTSKVWSYTVYAASHPLHVSAYHYSFFVDIIFFWNKLPDYVLDVYNSFKANLYKFLC